MMTTTQLSGRASLVFILVLLLVAGETFITRSSAFTRAPALLSLAVLFDLTILSSALFYWLLARPNNWSLVRTGLVALLMLRVGLFILPANTLLITVNGSVLLALAEIGALILAAIRIRTIRLTYLKLRPTTTTDSALQQAFAVVFGQQAANLILGEWQIVRYVVGGWCLQSDVPEGATPLTTHRNSGQIALTVALGSVCMVELVCIHLLVSRWSSDVAFWLTLASAYSMLMLVADIVATLKRPSYQTATTLYLRFGIRWQTVIPHDQISRIERIHDKPTRRGGLLNTAFLTVPNVLITLHKPITVQGPFGIRREATQLSIWLDGGTTALI